MAKKSPRRREQLKDRLNWLMLRISYGKKLTQAEEDECQTLIHDRKKEIQKDNDAASGLVQDDRDDPDCNRG